MTTANITPVPAVKEKIIFEASSLLLPTILNIENLITIGFVVIATIASVVFRFGLPEIIIVVLLFLVLFIPSLRNIFSAGSTTYVLTNYRIVVFTVGIGPKERSIPLERIASAKAKSSFFQRIYHAGDVVIKQKGMRGSLTMVGVMNPKKLADQVMQAAHRVSSQ